jgi:hypothetical protein
MAARAFWQNNILDTIGFGGSFFLKKNPPCHHPGWRQVLVLRNLSTFFHFSKIEKVYLHAFKIHHRIFW